jgi:hypothetical protein
MKATTNIIRNLILTATLTIGIYSNQAIAGNAASNDNNTTENNTFSVLSFGFENTPIITATSSDANKNVFVTGSVVISGYENAFLAKFDSKGNLLWKMVTGANHYGNSSNTLSVDNAGNSIITGHFSGEAQFGGITLHGARRSGFTASFDTNGNCISAQKIGTDIN